jgi:hypothetical protein
VSDMGAFGTAIPLVLRCRPQHGLPEHKPDRPSLAGPDRRHRDQPEGGSSR